MLSTLGLSLCMALASAGRPPAGQAVPAAPPAARGATPATLLGAPAPGIAGLQWLRGEPIDQFVKGKVYVVSFWSLLCAPTVASMPQLVRQQREHAGDGLVILAITQPDSLATSEAIKAYLDRKGEGIPISLALDDGRTHAAFGMGPEALPPMCFVVGRDGGVAWNGPPAFLEVVLPKVLDGTWKGRADAEALAASEADFRRIFAGARLKPEEALRSLAAFEAAHPELAPIIATRKLALLANLDRREEATALGRTLVDRHGRDGDWARLLEVANFLRGEATETPPAYRPIILDAANKAVEITQSGEIEPLYTLSDVESVFGSRERALSLAQAGVALAIDEGTKGIGRQLIWSSQQRK